MSIVVIRLHPEKPTDGNTFKDYLEGLEIKVGDRSFTDPKGVANVLGTARYIAEGDPAATIVQHVDPLTLLRQPVATAAVHVPDPFGFAEYRAPDLVLTITRTIPPNPAQTIVNHDVNFNVDLAPGALPASDPIAYAALFPVALYLAIPPRLVGLGPGVAYLEVPTDGTPPPFEAVLAAMTTVAAADPAAAVDLTSLTPEQCRHLAYEIVSNRTIDPLPAPPLPLEQLYSGGHETERRQFEADLLTYYTVRNTGATVLAKFVYSVSAALACAKRSQDATRVGFTFPILPGLGANAEKVRQTTVVISQ